MKNSTLRFFVAFPILFPIVFGILEVSQKFEIIDNRWGRFVLLLIGFWVGIRLANYLYARFKIKE